MRIRIFISLFLILCLCAGCAHSSSRSHVYASRQDACFGKSDGLAFIALIVLLVALGPPANLKAYPSCNPDKRAYF